jgi:hypothetical protein
MLALLFAIVMAGPPGEEREHGLDVELVEVGQGGRTSVPLLRITAFDDKACVLYKTGNQIARGRPGWAPADNAYDSVWKLRMSGQADGRVRVTLTGKANKEGMLGQMSMSVERTVTPRRWLKVVLERDEQRHARRWLRLVVRPVLTDDQVGEVYPFWYRRF